MKKSTNEKNIGLNHNSSNDISATVLINFFVELGPNLITNLKYLAYHGMKKQCFKAKQTT